MSSTAKRIPTKHEEDPYFGDKHTHKSSGNIRVWYTNPCGVGLDPHHPKSDDSFNFLKNQSQCDIFGLAETNVRWDKLYNSSSLYSRVKQRWRYFKISTSHNIHANLGVAQRGGTCTVSHGQAAYRICDRGSDESGLGRWSWLEYRGRQEHITRVYTAYRPGGKPSTAKRSFTTVYEQQMNYLREHHIKLQPRDYFDQSLQDELRIQLQRSNVVLLIDVNQDVQRGHFNREMNKLGLYNVLEKHLESNESLPSTHHRGSRPISAIYANVALHCTQCGILPKCVGIHGDHRNMYADFSPDSFLGSTLYEVVTQPMKRLQLKDPRTVTKFLKVVKKHLVSTNSLQKAEELFALAKYPCPEGLLEQMELLDDQFGRAISAGKKKCRHLYVGEIPYSDQFECLRDTRRLWLLIRKKKLGQNISSRTIRRLSKKLQIPHPLSYSLPMVDTLRLEAERQYKSLSKQTAKERREQFLQDLAAANAAASKRDKEKILARIIHDEQVREQTTLTRRYFPKRGTSEQRVDRIQYKDTDGQWQESNHPRTVLQACQKDTRDKYNDTGGTPLMENNTHRLFGNFAETQFSRDMQGGVKQIPANLDKWTRLMLQQTLHDPSIPRLPVLMTKSEIKSAWGVVKEHKSAAPSGRYNGIYKAICTDESLLHFLMISMNLPFMTGTTYSRWHKMIDIMIFKKPSNIRVDNIRAVIISEGDWNTSGKIHVTRRLMKQAEACHLLPKEHMGGRKGRKATDGSLTKRLVLDNVKVFKRSIAIVSTDAANCYDRMTHNYISFMCIKWGLMAQVLVSLLLPLQKARHHTRTAFGDSTEFFQGSNLQGAGQGNTSAAPFWTCISSPIIEIMKQHKLQSHFFSPLSAIIVTLSLIAFVDDTELFIMNNEDNVSELKQQAESAINLWRELLYVTGGIMRPSKCSWTMLSYDKQSMKDKVKVINNNIGEICIPSEDGQLSSISRYEADIPKEYLGVLQPANGSDEPQLHRLTAKVEEWNNLIQQSKLPPALNLKAIYSKIHKSLQYPLVTTAISYEKLQKVSNKLYWKSLPKCGIVRTFPIRYRHLPTHYQGLGLPDLYLEQELGKIRELISFSYTNYIVWDQLRLGLEGIQFQLGLSNLIYNYSYYDYSFLTSDTWIKSQWKFITDNHLRLQGWKDVQKTYRTDDVFLMEAFVDSHTIPDSHLVILNRCRQFLRVSRLSEIVDAVGKYITQDSYNGIRKSCQVDSQNTIWPQIVRPNVNHWFKWKHWINVIFCASRQNRRLQKPLGIWTIIPSSSWEWFYDQYNRRLYRKQLRHVKVYKMLRRRDTRTSNVWFSFHSILKEDVLMPDFHDLMIASINQSAQGGKLVCCDGWEQQPNLELPPSISQNINMEEILRIYELPKWMYKTGTFNQMTLATFKDMCRHPLRFVTDASYDEGHGTAAAIFESDNQKHRLMFVVSVPSNTDDTFSYNDAYRSEKCGILAGLTMIKLWEKHLSISVDMTISCDNDRALTFTEDFWHVSTRAQHFDIGKAIIRTKEILSSTLHFEQVEGHVKEKYPDRVLTRIECLNDSRDKIAKAARASYPKEPAAHIHMEGLSLWYEGNKLYSDFDSNIRKIYYDYRAKEVIMFQYGWSEEEFLQVDWKSLQRATKLLPQSSVIRMAKLVTSTLPVGEVMEIRKEWKESYCPRCNQSNEDQDHIFHCPHISCQKLLKTAITETDIWMKQMHTPVILKEQILYCMAMWLANEKVDIADDMLQPIKDQCKLGWNHFFEGRIVRSFTELMNEHYASNSIQKTGQAWASVLIQFTWRKFFERLWTHRNEHVHAVNKSKLSTREAINLNFSIKALYKDENEFSLLQPDRYLMTHSLTSLLKRPVSQKRGWLMAMKVAIADRNAYRSREEIAMSAQMSQFLCKVGNSYSANPQSQKHIQEDDNVDQHQHDNGHLQTQIHEHTEDTHSLEDRHRKRHKNSQHSTRQLAITNNRKLKKRVNLKRRRQITLASERWEKKRRQRFK